MTQLLKLTNDRAICEDAIIDHHGSWNTFGCLFASWFGILLYLMKLLKILLGTKLAWSSNIKKNLML
jgi:hypothetical protein